MRLLSLIVVATLFAAGLAGCGQKPVGEQIVNTALNGTES